MSQTSLFPHKWIQPVSLTVLFACIALFAFTGSYLFLAAPIGLLFITLMGLNWKAAYLILLCCILGSVEVDLIEGSLSTSVPDEPMMWLFVLMFGLMVARNPYVMPKWWWRNPLVFIIVLQFLWLLVAVIYSKELFLSLKFLAARIWFMVSFMILPVFIFKEKKDYRLAFKLMLFTLLITVVIIFLRHYALHFSFKKVQVAIRGIYVNHVDYSTVLSMFFPLLCVAYPLTKGKATWLRGLLLLTILFFLPAIYFAYARAAWIAIVFAGVIALAMRLKLVNLVMPAFYAAMALLLTYMIRDNKYIDFRPNYERTYMHKNFADHMIATLKGQDMSSMERLYRWIAGIRMSQDRPVTGYGPHAFYYYYKPYAVTAFKTYVSRNPEQSTTHNYFLYMLVEQGWPAMIIYAIFIFLVFWQAQKVYWRFTDRFYKYVTLGITMTFAAGFINNFFSDLIDTHKVGALFYIPVALLVILDQKSKELKNGQATEREQV